MFRNDELKKSIALPFAFSSKISQKENIYILKSLH